MSKGGLMNNLLDQFGSTLSWFGIIITIVGGIIALYVLTRARHRQVQLWKRIALLILTIAMALLAILCTFSKPIVNSLSQSNQPPTATQSSTTVSPSQSSAVTPTNTPTLTTVATTPQPSNTTTTSSKCPTDRIYDDKNQYRVDPLAVPQGCYMVVSFFNGILESPDQAGVPNGILIAYQGPISFQAEIKDGGFRFFTSEAEAKSLYCQTYKNPSLTHDITRTPHSLDWAPTC